MKNKELKKQLDKIDELKQFINFLVLQNKELKSEVGNLKFNLELTEETLQDYKKIANKFVS